MKKLLLCGVALSVALSVSAQNRVGNKVPLANASRYNKVAKAEKQTTGIDNYTPLRAVTAPSSHATAGYKTSATLSEYVIGNTLYDLQSNRGPARRVVNNGDGTISAVWTFSANQSGYPDRGTGYNYFDGTAWGAIPTTRVEGVKTGFANVSVVGGNEFTLAHNGTGSGVLMTRPKGNGTWTTYSPVGGTPPSTDVWFRMAAGGANNNTIHAIVNSQGSGTTPVLGQSGPLTYSRSTDGGATWDIQHVLLPGGDSAFYAGFSAENYSIDCRGDVVAIVAADLMCDVVMWKSTDNGTTWTKTVIEAAPIPAYNTAADYAPLISDADGDGIADTILSNAGDPNVTLDNNNMAHVTWSSMSCLDDDTTAGTSLGIFLTTSGINYWNENMSAPAEVAGLVDQNNDGVYTLPAGNGTDLPFGRYGNGGLTIHPQIGFDSYNNVFLVYSATSELTDSSAYNASLRHIFITYSSDMGATWSTPEDLVPSGAQGGDGEYQEGVWPSIARDNGSNIYVVYQRDPVPEYFVNNTTTVYGPQNQGVTNDIICVTWSNPVGVSEITKSSSFSMSQNFPNPFNGSTRFELNLKNNADVTVEVYNVLGKLVKSMNLTDLTAGINTVTLDLAGLNSGLYTYSVTVGSEKLTRTLMVK
jgi:hypothetical protein